MAYTKTNWVDRLDTGNKYNITDNPDGTKRIEYAGDVLREGTPISAEKLNNIENAIYTLDQAMGDVQTILESVVDV